MCAVITYPYLLTPFAISCPSLAEKPPIKPTNAANDLPSYLKLRSLEHIHKLNISVKLIALVISLINVKLVKHTLGIF